MGALKWILIIGSALILAIMASFGLLVGGTAAFVQSAKQGERVPLNHADLDVGSAYGRGEREALIAGCAKAVHLRLRARATEFCECVADVGHDLSSRVDRLFLARNFAEGNNLAVLRFEATLKKLGLSSGEIQRTISLAVQRGQSVGQKCAIRLGG